MLAVAATDKQIQPLWEKISTQLNWLNLNTQGGYKQLRQVKNSEADMWKRASMKTKDGEEHGPMSQIKGLVANNPRNVRGYRCHRLFYEESGSNPVLKTSWVQGEALVVRVGRKTGTRFAWGTGGDSGLALQGLAEMFNNPDIFGCLPCLHNFTPTGEFIYSGFFIPAYRMHFAYLDDRGVTDSAKAREWFDKNRNSKLDNPQAYLEYCSEYCYTPDEALVRQGENQFNQILLAEQLANITIHKIVKEPERGYLMGGNDDGKGGKNAIVWKPNAHEGDILLLEEPERDDNGNIIKNLYCAGIDSIDMGTNDSTGQLDVSDFCIVIYRRQRGVQEPRIVAIYKDRPRDIRVAYDNAFRLLDWYNAKCVLENSRTNIITYAREKKKLHHFLTRPRATITNLRTNTTMIGAPPTEGVVRHYLELIEQFINDYYQSIAYVDVINELMKYTYENKRKFDIVAALGMCLLADEELFAAPIESVARLDQEWRDIGYYTGPDGKKHFGSIPTRQKIIKKELGEGWM